MKTIYRDFDHWWREGKHGYSSYSRDVAKEVWDDFEPTILASRDDYKNAFVKLMNDQTVRRAELTDALLKYIEIFAKDAPGFWRWWMDQAMKDQPQEASEPHSQTE